MGIVDDDEPEDNETFEVQLSPVVRLLRFEDHPGDGGWGATITITDSP